MKIGQGIFFLSKYPFRKSVNKDLILPPAWHVGIGILRKMVLFNSPFSQYLFKSMCTLSLKKEDSSEFFMTDWSKPWWKKYVVTLENTFWKQGSRRRALLLLLVSSSVVDVMKYFLCILPKDTFQVHTTFTLFYSLMYVYIPCCLKCFFSRSFQLSKGGVSWVEC